MAELLLFGLFFLIALITIYGLGYHYLLLFLGYSPEQDEGFCATLADEADLRFALIVPAHNEETVISSTVTRMLQIAYPKQQYDVHVVADHCNDQTALLAQEAGAIVHERNTGSSGRKGYALEHIITQLLHGPTKYDAFIIFDADSHVDPMFLAEARRSLKSGAQVIQGQRIISNPDASLFSALDDADLRLNNRMRNQAKSNLKLSARLMGDGMIFHRTVFERFHWHETDSLTEDRAFGLYLVSSGLRVRFLPAARIYIQSVSRWRDATPQRLRWYGGAFDLQKRYLVPLWTAAIQNRSLDAVDKAVELITPPFSMVAVSSTVLLFASLLLNLWQDWPILFVQMSGTVILFTLFFPFLSLVLTKAHPSAYRAMLLGPFYVMWRVWLTVLVRLNSGQIEWVRTRRTEEQDVN
jgi:cellulose synthase/poly-beta-1,6-N-acetylglucosamine synthase-like glycosyltransferase